ncbi:MAG: transcriptional regulator, lacI family [Acidobacteria bacterium]|jgi:LacI family transcriptional regulator|nr:transcriptional regulator, lacI family [Acidobacteriota bacterium]
MSSIKDVARQAGVSTATVSHVLNNTRFVSDEVRARVTLAVEQCSYYPNAHARSLASGKSRIIGLVISDIANPFFPELVKSIESAAFEHGYDVMLSNTNYETERTSHYVQRFIERKVAGVAVMTSEMDKNLIDELARREVPVVFLDVGEAGLHMSNLRVDYEEGIEQAIRHLVELGHRRIAYISGNNNLRSSKRRLEAFKRTVHQLFPDEPALIFYGNLKVEGGRQAARELLTKEKHNLPTAIVAANDLMAIGAISEFEAANLHVPGDISIVGFDDIAFAGLTKPPLTTVRLPLEELGRCAVEALMNNLKSTEEHGVEIRISTSLIVRESTAPVRLRQNSRVKRKPGGAKKQTV